jgi:hypothetical protein
LRVANKTVISMRTSKIDKRFKRVIEEIFGPSMKCDGYLQALEGQILSGPLSLGAITANLAAAGAGVIPPLPGLALLTAAGVVTATLALPIAGAPSAGGDDGKVICIISTTANAHTVTTPTNGLNKTLHIATFAATVGAYMWLVAFSGTWYVLNSNGAAFAANVTLT